MPDVPSRWENKLIRIRDVASLRGHRTGRVGLGTPIYLYGPSPRAWTMIRTGNLCGQRFPDTCISTTRTDLYPGRHGVTRYSTTARRFRYTCYICDHNTGARVFSNSVRLSRD